MAMHPWIEKRLDACMSDLANKFGDHWYESDPLDFEANNKLVYYDYEAIASVIDSRLSAIEEFKSDPGMCKTYRKYGRIRKAWSEWLTNVIETWLRDYTPLYYAIRSHLMKMYPYHLNEEGERPIWRVLCLTPGKDYFSMVPLKNLCWLIHKMGSELSSETVLETMTAIDIALPVFFTDYNEKCRIEDESQVSDDTYSTAIEHEVGQASIFCEYMFTAKYDKAYEIIQDDVKRILEDNK